MRMSYEEAKLQLLLHTGSTDALGQLMMLPDGFLPSLRPYGGLHEKNFHLVMEALLTVGERIYSQPRIDRDLVQTIWWMCWGARAWGISPEGMLQSNKLITADDSKLLEEWTRVIEQTTLDLLGGSPPHKAVYHYAEYIVAHRWWDNIDFFIPLMACAVADPSTGSAVVAILRALGKLGGLAKSTLPTLNGALQSQYSWNRTEFETPVNRERTTESVHADIRKAVEAINGRVSDLSG